MATIQERANAFLDVLDRPFPKKVLWLWGIIATWDTFVSQFIPESISKDFPKAHQVIAMTYGWLSLQTWLVVGAILVALISLEWGARHKWKLELATGASQRQFDSRRPLLACFWLLLIVAIVGIWYADISHWGSARVVTPPAPLPLASPTASASPTSASTPKPPAPPPPPWVSVEEIDSARKAGRTLLPFKPEELATMGYSNGAANMTAYTGKWVKASAPFRQLTKKTLGDKKDYLIVLVYDLWGTSLLFEPKKWEDRLVQFKYNDRVAALCQLYGFNNDHSAILWNCELN